MLSSSVFSEVSRASIDTNAITTLCKAAGDPLRMQILRVLQQNSYGVLELCEVFDIRQSAMSHHLKILANASLVATRREGTSIFYRRNELNSDIDLQALQTSLFETIDNAVLDLNYINRLNSINTARSEASVSFFNRNADRFASNQDLIAGWDVYGESIETAMLRNQTNLNTAIEIGPGYGKFLSTLSKQFNNVTALDSSIEMLDQCKQHAKTHNLENIDFILGDTSRALLDNKQYDFISINMVLHHNSTPPDIISDCANLLKANGILMVTELCEHDQEWVKNSCGDIWLGFLPESLTRWAKNAGLVDSNSLYITQRNGFRIQVRQFNLANP